MNARVCFFLLLLSGLVAAPSAQAQSKTQPQAQSAPQWRTVCAEKGKPETCSAVYEMFLARKEKDGKTRTLGRLMMLTVAYVEQGEGKPRVPFLKFLLPLGIDLRPGAIARIDSGKEIQLPFLQCTQAGCELLLRLDGQLLRNLKAGANLRVGFRPLGSAETSVVTASLTGFSKAFRPVR